MENRLKSLVNIHFAVLLFGIAGLFGKLIVLPAIIITLGRVLFATLGLGLFFSFSKTKLKIESKKLLLLLIISGVILAFHWWTFFHSIQISTVAIGLLTFSSFPIFTVFLEPIFFKEKLYFQNIVIVIFTFLGIYLIVPDFDMSNLYFRGVIWGIISGFTFSIFQLFNRHLVKSITSLTITFYEVLVASIVLLPFLFFQNYNFKIQDILLLILLGTVFTALAHSLFIKGLKNVNVLTSSIITSLEPIYGIIFAIIILSEIPNYRVVIGGSLIIISNIFVVILKRRMKRI
jgi:drug/metabolite transporter (DMT)-like permease